MSAPAAASPPRPWSTGAWRTKKNQKRTVERPPDTRKHTVLPVSIRLKSTAKTPTCVSMRAFLQPISVRIYFGKTASHRKRARFVQSRGAPPQAYWMSVKAAQRWGCAKRAFCGVCFLMPGGLSRALVFSYSVGAHTRAQRIQPSSNRAVSRPVSFSHAR